MWYTETYLDGVSGALQVDDLNKATTTTINMKLSSENNKKVGNKSSASKP